MTPDPRLPALQRGPYGPKALAWLYSSPAYRNGRAMVREELARDFHAQGMTRAADREYEIAKAIRSGEQ